VTAAQYGRIADCTSNFCSALVGGNLALKPETADTFTAGMVLTPRSIPGLSLSLDYYDIKVSNLIGTVPAALAFSQCLTNGSPFYCSFIKRDATGSLATTGGYIVNTNVNTGFLHTAGLDVAAAYRLDLDRLGARHLGALALSMNGTWTRKQQVSPLPGQPSYDCAGLYGPTCGVPTPTWRHNARLSWETPWQATLSLSWRYIGSSTVDINAGNPAFSGDGRREGSGRCPDRGLQLFRSGGLRAGDAALHPAHGRDQSVRQGPAAARFQQPWRRLAIWQCQHLPRPV
jgi:outer membrane receptor protein involved in Fe transport